MSGLLNTYNRYNVEFTKGEGAYLYDKNGKEYLDFLCGIAVTGFGHNHPEIKSAVLNQINNYWHVSNLFLSSGQAELAKKLCERSGLSFVFFSNSGTEANEAAIKFARKWGKDKKDIISTFNSFHGRSFGSLSATGQYKLWSGFEPLVPGFYHTAYGNIEAINKTITEETTAIIIETIQGEGGINVAPTSYLKELRALCTEKNILFIIDEIQTGIGRTGKFFSYQYADILPDIVTSAKGIANGIPLGATICSEEIGKVIQPGNHGSTFGGNPVAIAAANKVVDLMDEKLLHKIQTNGQKIKEKIKNLNLPQVKDVRGKGFMIGVELVDRLSVKKLASNLLEEGLLVGTSGENVFRILPPYIIKDKEIDKFIDIFNAVIKSV